MKVQIYVRQQKPVILSCFNSKRNWTVEDKNPFCENGQYQSTCSSYVICMEFGVSVNGVSNMITNKFSHFLCSCINSAEDDRPLVLLPLSSKFRLYELALNLRYYLMLELLVRVLFTWQHSTLTATRVSWVVGQGLFCSHSNTQPSLRPELLELLVRVLFT